MQPTISYAQTNLSAQVMHMTDSRKVVELRSRVNDSELPRSQYLRRWRQTSFVSWNQRPCASLTRPYCRIFNQSANTIEDNQLTSM